MAHLIILQEATFRNYLEAFRQAFLKVEKGLNKTTFLGKL